MCFAGASDVAAACDLGISAVVAGILTVQAPVTSERCDSNWSSALVAAVLALAAGFVAAGVVSATVLVSTKDAVVHHTLLLLV